jgi:hypothetical protein
MIKEKLSTTENGFKKQLDSFEKMEKERKEKISKEKEQVKLE